MWLCTDTIHHSLTTNLSRISIVLVRAAQAYWSTSMPTCLFVVVSIKEDKEVL